MLLASAYFSLRTYWINLHVGSFIQGLESVLTSRFTGTHRNSAPSSFAPRRWSLQKIADLFFFRFYWHHHDLQCAHRSRRYNCTDATEYPVGSGTHCPWAVAPNGPWHLWRASWWMQSFKSPSQCPLCHGWPSSGTSGRSRWQELWLYRGFACRGEKEHRGIEGFASKAKRTTKSV